MTCPTKRILRECAFLSLHRSAVKIPILLECGPKTLVTTGQHHHIMKNGDLS
jgi:hypothetical protein